MEGDPDPEVVSKKAAKAVAKIAEHQARLKEVKAAEAKRFAEAAAKVYNNKRTKPNPSSTVTQPYPNSNPRPPKKKKSSQR